MNKDTSKIIPRVYVDSFRVTSSGIEAYCIIDHKDIDFHINQDAFETWCDENELRDFYYDNPGENDAPDEVFSGKFSWPEIYQGVEILTSFLKAYIEFVYEQDAIDFQPALNSILNQTKQAI